jgi:hypothetical protein
MFSTTDPNRFHSSIKSKGFQFCSRKTFILLSDTQNQVHQFKVRAQGSLAGGFFKTRRGCRKIATNQLKCHGLRPTCLARMLI